MSLFAASLSGKYQREIHDLIFNQNRKCIVDKSCKRLQELKSPGTLITGQLLKYTENFSAFSVAEVTITLKSFSAASLSHLWCTAAFTNPKRMSVWIDRSCASSSMITLYFVSKGSFKHSRTRIPSVINFNLVTPGFVLSECTKIMIRFLKLFYINDLVPSNRMV